MSNIFRSKEVFKKLSTVTKNDETNSKYYQPFEDGKSIVKVRGVYVTGEYRPPFYIDSGLTINSIESNQVNIVNYTKEDIELEPDGVLNITDINSHDDLVITPYTVSELELKPDGVLNIIDVSSPDELNVFWYSHIEVNTDPSGVLNITDINSYNDLAIAFYDEENHETAPEPCLRITSISTNTALVENI